MATIICVDGLGGHSATTFREVNAVFGKYNRVMLVDTSEVITHDDRINLVIDTARQARVEMKDEKIFLLGQSAGGSAVRIVAERLESEGFSLAGVILISSAMPRGILFMTSTLWNVMKKNIFSLLLGWNIDISNKEYEALTSPFSAEMRAEILFNRETIPGKESRELAFFPPKLKGYHAPTLLIWGAQDKWIAPKAQGKLCRQLQKTSKVQTFEVKRAGHLPLASCERLQVLHKIREWIYWRD
jgi:pimeloyl-ACP methyl ester carboxylesterase